MNPNLKNKKETNPSYWLKLGDMRMNQGEHDEAIQFYKNAVHLKPDDINTYFIIGTLQQKLSLFNQAIDTYHRVIELDPHHVEAHYNMAVALHFLGQFKKAIFCYQKAIRLKPDFIESYYNMGSAFHDLKKYHEAIIYYQKTLRLDHTYYPAQYNMGNAYKELGDFSSSLRCYQDALKIKPDLAEAHNNMGIIYKDLKVSDKAESCYLAALEINPRFVEAHYNMGIVLQIQGKYKQGLKYFKKAHELDPAYLPARWLYLLSLPMIYRDEEEIVHYRKRFTENLEKLTQEIKLDTPDQIKHAIQGISSTTNFFLQYQGMNDLILQKKYAGLVCNILSKNYPHWSKPRSMPRPGENGKIRLGFLSSFMYAHTVGLFLLGWLQGLNKKQFELYGYHIGHATDSLTENIQSHCDRFIKTGSDIETTAGEIISDDLHVLTFTDIGMNAPATLLASLRLAPLQCKGWGHPVTTGLPTIDYYLSSALMEPENAQAFYSEKLIRLPNLALFYQKPDFPSNLGSRSDLGIRKNAFVYLTTQSIFKYLPRYDHIYPEIAARVPRAQFVFISHASEYLTRLFRERIALEFKKHGLQMKDHCLFVPRLNFSDFLNLNMVCDVLLDTISWSGGKTTLEAISCGLPVVTLPGQMMRGRHTLAILKRLGITETIAGDENEYVKIAMKLGRDKHFYQTMVQKIKAGRHKLYEDREFMRGLEGFYHDVVHKNMKRSE